MRCLIWIVFRNEFGGKLSTDIRNNATMQGHVRLVLKFCQP